MQVEMTELNAYIKLHKLSQTGMGKALTPPKPRQRINTIVSDGNKWYVIQIKTKLKLMRFQ